MRDPHVVALQYQFESADTHPSFEGAQALRGTLGDFDFELNDARLVARPRSHFADEESARAALEPRLRAWEQRTFLSEDMHITFKYAKTEIIDRDPMPGIIEARPDPITLNAVLYAPTVIVGHAAYPPPDPDFKVTPVTDRMSERIRRVRAGQAPLPAEAYWVLTQLETDYGTAKNARKSVAERLNVEDKVLQTLGRLSAQGTRTSDVRRIELMHPSPTQRWHGSGQRSSGLRVASVRSRVERHWQRSPWPTCRLSNLAGSPALKTSDSIPAVPNHEPIVCEVVDRDPHEPRKPGARRDDLGVPIGVVRPDCAARWTGRRLGGHRLPEGAGRPREGRATVPRFLRVARRPPRAAGALRSDAT